MEKELLILKRRKAKELHEKGWSNRKIAKYLLASKDSVGKWVQMDESEISSDNRGWKRGKSRTYTPETKQQIINRASGTANQIVLICLYSCDFFAFGLKICLPPCQPNPSVFYGKQ
ncbi:MAG: terminase gpP N-terminus-related DNA-binding protein [Methanosarcinales archaeon]